jgi:hypothetical protein
MNITRSSVYSASVLTEDSNTSPPTTNPALIKSGAPGVSRSQFRVISQPEVDITAATRRT